MPRDGPSARFRSEASHRYRKRDPVAKLRAAATRVARNIEKTDERPFDKAQIALIESLITRWHLPTF